MEGRIQALVSMILIVTLCATILLQPGLAEVQVTPQFTSFPGSPIDLTKCWSSLFSVEDCVIDIYKFSVTGKFGINQACCKAFMDMDDKFALVSTELFSHTPHLIMSLPFLGFLIPVLQSISQNVGHHLPVFKVV
ncbi:BnaC04g36610D [Brassica napus]|uniref:BnaC04g36610D protein n=1 Tax=Brassica napus TaxID=3708 RepID=A0A078G161_BRANA|nr:BnaC04g36610D [Brassica napus]